MAVHKPPMEAASASVFLLTWRSSAACLRGSRVSLAPQSASSRSISQSCSCQVLYLKPESRTLTQEDGSSYRSSLSKEKAGPDLQAGAPGAHALPQQQVVEGDGADDIIQLSDHLFDEVVVHAVPIQGGVEVVQVLQEDLHRDGLLLQEADATLPPARRLGLQHGLGGLGVQYAPDYTC